MNTRCIVMLFLAFAIPRSVGQSGAKLTFVEKTKTDTYVFRYKGNTIKATCDFRDISGTDGEFHKNQGHCPLDLLPGTSVVDRDSFGPWGACKPWSSDRTYAIVNTETVVVSREGCRRIGERMPTAEEEDWEWESRDDTYFQVISMSAGQRKK